MHTATMKRRVRIPIVVILLLIQTCAAALSSNCPASSCGNIPNISYPFRLGGDPSHCGDTRYQLQCENNATLLTLFSGQYRVQEIDYKRYKIRVSDAEDGTCSSMPRYFLQSGNFSNDLIGPGTDLLKLEPFFQPSIAYFNCSYPIADDPRYVAVEASGCDLRGHVYAFVRDSQNGFGVKDIKVGCQLMVATFAGVGEHKSNEAISYSEIYKMLSQGFELSWLYVICENRCGKRVDCSVDESTHEVRCQQDCRYIYEEPNSVTYECSSGSNANIIYVIVLFCIGLYRGLMRNFGLNKATGYDGDIAAEIGKGVGRYILPYFIIRFIFGVVVFAVLLIYKGGRRHKSKYENIEAFLQENTLAPIRYSYKEIKHMTRGFKEKLGQGGFGLVYKGKLRSGSFVAIKMLSKSKSDGQDFISEVGTIGRIHHTNVVRLIGFCVESSNHALVYEFMPNGSLDKYIFSKQDIISLTQRQIYEISLGVARGIAYLHEGCDMQILHFDIKPHNILLDENFVPKVSDFGLARLYPTDKSIITLTDVRGTLGYMAPELFYHNFGGVSYKADVYSFGMLLMEMTNRKRNFNPHANDSSEFFFPLWIYHQLSGENEIEGENVTKQEYNDEIKKMFLIALWCIQLKPSDRPPMIKVVEMLEGELENIEMPPKPSLYQINDHKTKSYETSSNDYSGSTSYTEESIVHISHISSEFST